MEQIPKTKAGYHFFFNTMNCLAAMAVEKQAFDIYSGIVQLSNLFRYQLEKDGVLTKLEKELDYAKDYLDLQKLRYEEQLDVNLEIADEVRQFVVPAGFLLPLIENAFVHGLDRIEHKIIAVRAYSASEKLFIYVENNGGSCTEKEYSIINETFLKDPHCSMGTVWQKLSAEFSEFTFCLRAGNNGGSIVEIIVPLRNE